MKGLFSMAVVRLRQSGPVAAVVLLFAVGGVAARAHRQHDVVEALSLSATFSLDGIALAVASQPPDPHRHQLLRTQDGGLSWNRVVRGLDNRGSLDAILLSPNFTSDQTVFASGQVDGIYRSQDGGTSWQSVNTGLPSLDVRLLASAVDAQGQLVLLAASDNGGLERSEDLGATWTTVHASPRVVSAIAFSPRFAQNGVVAAGDLRGNIWRSGDRGQTWSLLVGSRAVGSITALAISEGGTSFIGTEEAGLFRTDDGGQSFQQLNECLPTEPIAALVLSPEFDQDQTLFLATSDQGVFKSTDGGLCWTKFDAGLVNIDDEWVGDHFHQLQISSDFAADQTLFVAMYDGLFKSSDSGNTWFQLETVPESIIYDVALSPIFGYDATLGLGRYGGGVSISRDGGVTWSPSNVGLARPWILDLEFSPTFSDDQTVFALHAVWFAPKSVDGGWTWSKGVRAPPHVYPSVVGVSPAFASDRTFFLGTRWHGIYRTTDGGSTFTNVVMDSGIPGADSDRIDSLVVSSGYVSDFTVFAGIETDGVLRSTDGGTSWQVANSGLTRDKNQGPQLQISPVFPKDQTLFAATRKGLFRTTEAGQSWDILTIADNPPVIRIEFVSISPEFAVDRTLLVSVRGRGLYKSTDAGDSWTEVGAELIAGSHVLQRIVFSAQFASDRTVLGTTETGLFRSTDGGDSWVQIDAGPVRIENDHPTNGWLFYEGDWKWIRLVDASLLSVHFTRDAGASSRLFFNGTGVDWVGVRAESLGIAEVYLDGVLQSVVDQYGIPSVPPADTLQTLFSIQGLASGFHQLELVATDQKNPDSTGFGLVVDAFDVHK